MTWREDFADKRMGTTYEDDAEALRLFAEALADIVAKQDREACTGPYGYPIDRAQQVDEWIDALWAVAVEAARVDESDLRTDKEGRR